MRSNPQRQVVCRHVVWCALVLSTACLPKQSCELTKTCEPDAATTSAEATSSSSVTSTTASEGGISSAASDAAMSSAQVMDAAASSSAADAHVETPAVACTRSIDCTVELPYCDTAASVCTACREARDCKDANAPFCLIDVAAAQYNRCVECLGGELGAENECSDGVCVDHGCVACNVATNDGCSGETPVCVNLAGAPTCVACDDNADCEDTPGTPTCSGHVCKACSTADPSACPGEQPVCVEEVASSRCVECTESAQCQARADDGEISVCVQEQCTRCVLGTAEGCTPSAPYCAALVPSEGDAGIEYLSPGLAATPTANQYLEYDHTCVECVVQKDCEGGSLPSCVDGQCVECSDDSHCEDAEASICDVASHTCVGCQDVGDCAHISDTKACDTAAHVCVECTAAEDTCGDQVCQTIPGNGQYTCSGLNKGQTSPCFECLSDSSCLTGSKCVRDEYDEVDGGWRCLWREPDLGNGDTCPDLEVFGGPVEATSIEGVVGPYCHPKYTSCEGYRDYGVGPVTGESGQATCLTNDDCGLPGADDGVCVPISANSNRCTYRCTSDQDCDAQLTCGTTNDVGAVPSKVCLL